MTCPSRIEWASSFFLCAIQAVSAKSPATPATITAAMIAASHFIARFIRSNMWISRQFRRLSRVLANKSDFPSFLRNRPPTREFSFLYPVHPGKPPSCTTILVAESQDLKPQMQTVLSSRAVVATSILTTFLETILVVTRALQKEVGGRPVAPSGSSFFFALTRYVLNQSVFSRSQAEHN